MYNRYIPQPDGSYKKKQIAEPRRQTPKNTQPRPQKPRPEPCPPPKPSCEEEEVCIPEPQRNYCTKNPPCRQDSITDFFKHLLPKNLDTADLLIILLLLLMAGDCQEDKNTALLTLALYFFM